MKNSGENPFLKKIADNITRMQEVTSSSRDNTPRTTNVTPPNPLLFTQAQVAKQRTHSQEVTTGGNMPDVESNFNGPDENISRVEDVIRSESRAAAKKLMEELTAPGILNEMRATVLATATPKAVAEDGDSAAGAIPEIEEHLGQLEAEFRLALESGNIGQIVHTNPFARIATSKAIDNMQSNIMRRLDEIKTIKPTPYVGRHADLRNRPITSLLEYVRFVPEIGIAFIAGNSAKNMLAELMAQAESTSQMSYDNRLVVASAAGVVMSYMAYQLRHSMYMDAQKHGHTYARLPVAPLTASLSAYKNVLRRHPIRTSARTAMAFGVALAGGNVLLNLAGVSGKSVEFGQSTLTVTKPLDEQMRKAGGVMETFFEQIDARCRAIVDAEVDPTKASKGTGKGAQPKYGPLAAAKDFLCFGKTEGGRVPSATLVAFRTSIGFKEGESVAQLYQRLWEARAEKRKQLLDEFAVALKTFQELVQKEADTSFATHVEHATLKHIPENKIPAAKATLVSTINAYVDEINSYSKEVDGISKRIATEGLSAAQAVGQNIEIQTPQVSISTEALEALPNSPVGKTGFFLSKELAPGTKETLSKVPGLNFVTPLLSNNPPLLTFQLSILALLLYLGGENIPNAFFVARERQRSRRLAKEMDPKRRDYYTTLDKLAEQIADIVGEAVTPYKQLFGDLNTSMQSREQLIASIKYAIVSDMEDAPDGSEHPLRDYAAEKARSMAHLIKHFYDWGPEEAAELDRAIGKLRTFQDELKKGSPLDNAETLARLKIPGAEILRGVFNKELTADPVRFAEFIAKEEVGALQHNVRYLVLKMQARQYVLNQLSSRITVDNSDRSHAEQVRDFLSRGAIVPLDGSGGAVTLTADETKYYRAWAELAAEQEQDQRDLFRVAVAGRTYWDRKFKADHALGTVEIPEEFREEFIAAATAEPFGDAALLVESYKHMLNRMLERQTDGEDFVETLNYLNKNAIPEIVRGIEDEPRLNDAFSTSFSCAFSLKHGGPVLRCDLYDAKTGAYADSVEAPFVVGESTGSAAELNERIRSWFGEKGSGRLEVIARARHHALLSFIKTNLLDTTERGESSSGTISLSNSETTPSAIERAQKEILYRATFGRQWRRIESVATQPLQADEMPLFELPETLFSKDLSARDVRARTGISLDGLFHIDELVSRIRSTKIDGVSIDLDVRQGVLLVTPTVSPQRIPLRRNTAPTATPFRLSALRNIDKFLSDIEQLKPGSKK